MRDNLTARINHDLIDENTVSALSLDFVIIIHEILFESVSL